MESKNIYLREMEVSYGRKKIEVPAGWNRRIASSLDAHVLFNAYVDHPQEHFLALAVDVRNRPIAFREIFRGTLSTCQASLAEVFRFALLASASRLVVAHNHPSGDPTPSREDAAITDRLCRLGEELGIQVLDHLVVASEGYFSFLDAGLLPMPTSKS